MIVFLKIIFIKKVTNLFTNNKTLKIFLTKVIFNPKGIKRINTCSNRINLKN